MTGNGHLTKEPVVERVESGREEATNQFYLMRGYGSGSPMTMDPIVWSVSYTDQILDPDLMEVLIVKVMMHSESTSLTAGMLRQIQTGQSGRFTWALHGPILTLTVPMILQLINLTCL